MAALPVALVIGVTLGHYLTPIEIVATCVGAWIVAEVSFFLTCMISRAIGAWLQRRKHKREEAEAAALFRELERMDSRDAQLLEKIRLKSGANLAAGTEAEGTQDPYADGPAESAFAEDDPDTEDPWTTGRVRKRGAP